MYNEVKCFKLCNYSEGVLFTLLVITMLLKVNLTKSGEPFLHLITVATMTNIVCFVLRLQHVENNLELLLSTLHFLHVLEDLAQPF